MRYKNLLFDLDGTLTDPGLGITNSILYALEKEGFPTMKREQLYPFIGPPLLESFRKYCGATESQSLSLLKRYREYFADKGLFENEVYPQIPSILAKLKTRGHKLYLATSKPEPFAKKILEYFNLSSLFAFVGGSTLEETRTDKAEVIRYVLDTNHISAADSLMIGDRIHDLKGAAACGMDFCGVLYGYGSREEFENVPLLCHTPSDLLKIPL